MNTLEDNNIFKSANPQIALNIVHAVAPAAARYSMSVSTDWPLANGENSPEMPPLYKSPGPALIQAERSRSPFGHQQALGYYALR